MSVFGGYANYYDLLYGNKDYPAEVDYVDSLIQQYRKGANRILDLGCGTGRHDLLLAEKGYCVTGVDRSKEMLAIANAGLAERNEEPSDVRFHQGDVREVQLDETFDVVVALFHVMSYQSTNEDLANVFATARRHLRPGGVFIFDCWYGPAVLAEGPEVRVKRLGNEEIDVVRICEPKLYSDENCVDVNYRILITQRASRRTEEITECHRMRYLFMPEIDNLATDSGMEKLFVREWLSGRNPGLDTWSVCAGLTVRRQ